MQIILAKKIKEKRKAAGLTQQEISKKLLIKRSKWASYEEDRAKPKVDELLKIAKFFSTSVEDLLIGEQKNNNEIQHYGSGKVEEAVPLYGKEAMAELGHLFEQPEDQKVVGTIKIPMMPRCDGAVIVVGDSMYPLIKSGDIVLYKQMPKKITSFIWGEIYLLDITVGGDSQTSVKYVHKGDKEGSIKLVSYNKHYEDKDIALKYVKAFALIKASIRKHVMG